MSESIIFAPIPESTWLVEQFASAPSGVVVCALRTADGEYIAIKPMDVPEDMEHFSMVCIGLQWAFDHAEGPCSILAYDNNLGEVACIECDYSAAVGPIQNLMPWSWAIRQGGNWR